ncbi:MAG: PepSY domain-containing protein, partial [Rhodospirillales bacterium]
AHVGPVFAIQQGLLPLDRVLPVVQRAVPGRVLDVQVVGSAYRVKVLTPNGRVAHVMVDGRSGPVHRLE